MPIQSKLTATIHFPLTTDDTMCDNYYSRERSLLHFMQDLKSNGITLCGRVLREHCTTIAYTSGYSEYKFGMDDAYAGTYRPPADNFGPDSLAAYVAGWNWGHSWARFRSVVRQFSDDMQNG